MGARSAPRIVDRFSDLADVLAGAIALTGTLFFATPANPTAAQQVYLTSRPVAASPNSAGFNFTHQSFVNAGGGDQSNRGNEVWAWGYNDSGTQPSHDKSGEPQFHWSMESFYNPVAGTSYFEQHFIYSAAGGSPSTRIWSTSVRRETHTVDTGFLADVFYINDRNNVPIVSIKPGNFSLLGSTAVTVETHNTPALIQLNAAGNGYIEALRVTSLNRVSIAGRLQVCQDSDTADTETSLLVQRNKAGVYSLQRVSMGAVDSGGAGFKLLRVAN